MAGEEGAGPAGGAAPPPGARAGASEPAAHRRAARVAAENAAVADLWVRQPAYLFAASFSPFLYCKGPTSQIRSAREWYRTNG